MVWFNREQLEEWRSSCWCCWWWWWGEREFDDVFNNILFNWIELNELKIFSEEQVSEEWEETQSSRAHRCSSAAVEATIPSPVLFLQRLLFTKQRERKELFFWLLLCTFACLANYYPKKEREDPSSLVYICYLFCSSPMMTMMGCDGMLGYCAVCCCSYRFWCNNEYSLCPCSVL